MNKIMGSSDNPNISVQDFADAIDAISNPDADLTKYNFPATVVNKIGELGLGIDKRAVNNRILQAIKQNDKKELAEIEQEYDIDLTELKSKLNLQEIDHKENLRSTQIEIIKKINELQKSGRISESTAKELSTTNSEITGTDSLIKEVEDNADLFGPIKGNINKNNPYFDRAQNLRRKLHNKAYALWRQIDNRLSDQDLKLAVDQIGNLETPAAQVTAQLKYLMEKASTIQQDKIKGLESAGYNLNPGESMSLPSLDELTGGNKPKQNNKPVSNQKPKTKQSVNNKDPMGIL